MQELADEAVTQHKILMDHLDVCCSKRSQVRVVAAEVVRLRDDVDALYRVLAAAVAASAATTAGAGASAAVPGPSRRAS